MTLLVWTKEEKLAIAAQQLSVLKEIGNNPIQAAAAKFMPELMLRPEQAMYLYHKDPWNLWFYCGARGVGKTLSLIFWILYEMSQSKIPLIFSLVSPTNNDITRTVIEGDSGFIRNTPQWMELKWRMKDNVLTFRGGHVVRCFSSEQPSVCVE